MKYIVASGCSFTDPRWVPHKDPIRPKTWDSWPEIIAKWCDNEHLVKNVGEMGASTHLIIKNASQEIHKGKKVDLVLLQLTDWSRWSVYGSKYNAFHAAANQLDPIDTENRFRSGIYTWRHTSPQELITENFLMILNFIHTCKSLGIKVLIGQNHIGPISTDLLNNILSDEKKIERIEDLYPGLTKDPALKRWTDRNFILNEWITNPYFKELDKHKDCLIGWPWFPELGGKTVSSSEFEISERDHHPNAIGQEFIAEQYFRRM